MSKSIPTSIIIFGASGDLARRKLIPAIFNLFQKRKTTREIRILGYGNTPFSDDQFRDHLREGMSQYGAANFNEDEWRYFTGTLHYQQGKYTDPADFRKLNERLDALESGAANRLYYMAVPPAIFPNIIHLLGLTGQIHEDGNWRRVVIEKPFGTNLASAQQLNQQAHKTLGENQIYRIDHYLGKETVQNILFTRFANTIFEPVWNRNYIDHVQISVTEQVGVEHRAGYYDTVGVLRDMFQNHLLQLLTLVAMEPPASFNAAALRNEKVKVLSAIAPMTPAQVATDSVRAQYEGYRGEPEVKVDSNTPTYAALKLHINNWRWQGVPFYLRSGKNLAGKKSQIVIQFKEPPLAMFPMPPGQKMRPNLLVLSIQPDEGVHIRFEAKAPDTIAETRSVEMDFNYADSFGPTAIPEAYERLILDALQGDASLFTRADEVETAWSLIDPILQTWESAQTPALAGYRVGTWGPAESDSLLARDGRAWLDDKPAPQ